MDYPRSLYKSGGKLKWGKDKFYSSILVKDDESFKDALDKGYIDSFADALNKDPTVKEQPSWKELAIECGLEGDDLKAFMKKNTANKKKQLEKLKG